MESEAFEFVATQSLDGERIDRAVALLLGCGRTYAGDLIAKDRVYITDSPAKSNSQKISEGDFIQIFTVSEEEKSLEPDLQVEFEVVYEAPNYLVINKPAGLVVHPGAGNPDKTLANGLLARYPEIASAGGDALRPGIIHRLDKDTSGLMLVAKTPQAFEYFSNAISERKVVREYEAICWGKLSDKRGIIDAPIKRSVKSRKKMSIQAEGKPAVTHYEVIQKLYDATHLKCWLQSGRTHQIRVHLSSIGHPVVGDLLYSRRKLADFEFSRLALFAKRLVFKEPAGNEAAGESALGSHYDSRTDSLGTDSLDTGSLHTDSLHTDSLHTRDFLLEMPAAMSELLEYLKAKS